MSLNQASPDPPLAGPPPGFVCVKRGEGPGVSHVVLSGELDMATAPQLAETLAEVPDGSVAVILDLSGLEFMDSSGLQTILSAHARLADAGCRLVLIPGCHQVQRIFEITGAGSRLEFVNAPDAVRSG